ncbi:hypothetical protein Leryth_017639, partial [Lithospermum erythrorhizon]
LPTSPTNCAQTAPPHITPRLPPSNHTLSPPFPLQPYPLASLLPPPPHHHLLRITTLQILVPFKKKY